MASTEMNEYEDIRREDRHIHVYDDIKNDNKLDHEIIPAWNQWFKTFLLTFTVSLMTAGLVLIVMYFTIIAHQQQKLYLLEKQLTDIEKKNEIKWQEIENLHNLTERVLAQLHKKLGDIENKNEKVENRNNFTFSHLEKQFNDSTEQVVMTAQSTSANRALTGIMKFDDVKFSVGINNLSEYENTGKFVVEKEGLYLISVTINSDTNDARYIIYLNGNAISDTYIAYTSSPPTTMYNSGTVVIVRQLSLNDSLWVYFPGRYFIRGNIWSTLTIVKLK